MNSDSQRQAEEIIKIFRRGEEFTTSLLKENEQLRYKMLELEEELCKFQGSGDCSTGDAGAQEQDTLELANKGLLEENNSLVSRLDEVAKENEEFAQKYVEIEEENNRLANLYISSYQLHSTLDFDEVINIVVEILINLLGAETLMIMLMKDNSNELVTVVSEGIENGQRKTVTLGDGVIGRVAKEGEPYYADDLSGAIEDENHDYPIVCIPLAIEDHIIGVISIYSLLCQKEQKLNDVDYDLLTMLAGHAATAIFSSKLYSQSERKLSTIQNFLDLLSNT